MAQLKMIFNAENTPLPELTVTEGFRLRTIADSELESYNAPRVSVGFPAWEPGYLRKFRSKVLPDSMFLVEETASGRFAASATAETSDMTDFSQLGVLGWVMTHPDFRGQCLGRSASIAAMLRLYEAGYRAFSLLTDDFRLAAVKTYLNLGWKPWLYLDDMESRWRALADTFNRDFESLGCLPEQCSFPGKKPEAGLKIGNQPNGTPFRMPPEQPLPSARTMMVMILILRRHECGGASIRASCLNEMVS